MYGSAAAPAPKLGGHRAAPADAQASSSSEMSEADYLGAKYQATQATARALYGSSFDAPAQSSAPSAVADASPAAGNYTTMYALEALAGGSHYNTAPVGASHYNTAPLGAASHYNTAPPAAARHYN